MKFYLMQTGVIGRRYELQAGMAGQRPELYQRFLAEVRDYVRLADELGGGGFRSRCDSHDALLVGEQRRLLVDITTSAV